MTLPAVLGVGTPPLRARHRVEGVRLREGFRYTL
jgi:hypothetical protein